MQREMKADNAAVWSALGRKYDQVSFFFLLGGTKFTHAQYVDIMYELYSTRQKFDV